MFIPLFYLKKKQVAKMRKKNQESIRALAKEGIPYDDLLEVEKKLYQFQEEMNKHTSTVVQK